MDGKFLMLASVVCLSVRVKEEIKEKMVKMWLLNRHKHTHKLIYFNMCDYSHVIGKSTCRWMRQPLINYLNKLHKWLGETLTIEL